MSDIKSALTRKLGPFPAWAWLSVFGVLVWYYRNKISGGGQSANTADTTTGQVVSDASTPQTPVTLAPGEAAYDPNTGNLVANPDPGSGSNDTGSSNGANPDQGMIDAINHMADVLGQVPTGAPPDGGSSGPGKPPGHGKMPKLRGKGAIRAPFGHNKPKAPKGMKAIGLGKGFWEFLPKAKSDKRKSKPKTASFSSSKPKLVKGGMGNKQKRSSAAIKTSMSRARSPVSAVKAKSPLIGPIIKRGAGPGAAKPAQRSRPTQPIAHTGTPNQRPVATHPVPHQTGQTHSTTTVSKVGKAPASKPAPRTPTPAKKPATRKR